MSRTFVFELREAAASCSNVDYRAALRAVADDVSAAISEFGCNGTRKALRDLNGVWSHAERVLKNVPPEADPAPLSGGTEPARLAA